MITIIYEELFDYQTLYRGHLCGRKSKRDKKPLHHQRQVGNLLECLILTLRKIGNGGVYARKKLSEYIFVISEKSPVKFRWNIVSRLLNTSVDVIENLYHANYEKGDERVMWQKKAMLSLNLLDFYTETAKTKQAITFRQMEIIALQIYETKKLLSGWVRSTKKEKAVILVGISIIACI